MILDALALASAYLKLWTILDLGHSASTLEALYSDPMFPNASYHRAALKVVLVVFMTAQYQLVVDSFVTCAERQVPFLRSTCSNHPNDLFSLSMANEIVPHPSISLDNLANKNILVVGGSGRVGGSVVCQLVQNEACVTVGGTSLNSFSESQARWKTLFPSTPSDEFDDVAFVELDRESATRVKDLLERGDYDLVVHTAGPFQGKVATPNGVIEAAVEMGVKYVDVCDDYCTARAAKTKYEQLACENEVPCIISTGCWVSLSFSICPHFRKRNYEYIQKTNASSF